MSSAPNNSLIRRGRIAVVLSILAAWPSSVASARPPRARRAADAAGRSERAQGGRGQQRQAQRSFQLGVEAARQERWVEARTHFESAYQLSPRPVVLINLAGAQARTGLLTAALRNYRRIAADRSAQMAPFRRAAEEVLPALEARIPRLEVVTSGLLPDDVIRLDGDIVTAEQAAAGRELDPGEHEVVVQGQGGERARVTLVLTEGESRSVTVPLASTTPTAIPRLAATAPESAPLLGARNRYHPNDRPDDRLDDRHDDRQDDPHDHSRGDLRTERQGWWSTSWPWAVSATAAVAVSAVVVFFVARGNDDPYLGNVSPGTVIVK